MTKETYAQVKRNTPIENLGGMSNAMAIRNLATYGYYDTEEEIADVSRKVMFTHKNEEALSGGEFFARVTHRVTHRVIHGATPLDAIETVAVNMNEFIQGKVAQAIAKVKSEKIG